MNRETQVAPDIQGYAQKDTIKKRIHTIANILAHEGHSRSAFVNTISEHFDDIEVDWTKPRSVGQINAIVPSIYSALNFAHFSSKGSFLTDAEVQTSEQYWTVITDVLKDPEAKDIFHERIDHMPITFLPGRVAPIQHIISHFAKNRSGLDVTLVDTGAGPGYMGPLLDITGEIPIHCGISVDKLTRDEAVLYAKANGDDQKREQIDRFTDILDEERFPFVVADLTDTATSLQKIRVALAPFERDGADVVITSFVRYQMPQDAQTQNNFCEFTKELLHDHAIWVDIGEEISTSNEQLRYNVNVYQKRKNALEHVGVPFVIADRGTILNSNSDYFNSAI